ncbi:MAG: hypothetical protein ETSY1_31505 [Candidatus Entotheonella factor]|uniref:Uncharacterized protein n=1 Tax=Entotheonella factor TaxID=1429438 RepID=W4LB48_ENTF1|nr:MAG: hypothetical protein ETSY1_31505 [Candidatus Entotheonella factor]
MCLVYFLVCRYKEPQLHLIKANRVKMRGAKLLAYLPFSDGIRLPGCRVYLSFQDGLPHSFNM